MNERTIHLGELQAGQTFRVPSSPLVSGVAVNVTDLGSNMMSVRWFGPSFLGHLSGATLPADSVVIVLNEGGDQ